jgi:hypothetical protein
MQRALGYDINLSLRLLFQFQFQPHEIEQTLLPSELDQNVEIAVPRFLTARERAEEGGVRDIVPLQNGSQLAAKVCRLALGTCITQVSPV